MRRPLRAGRQIEFTVYQPLGALLRVVGRVDGAAIDGDQAATDHRVPVITLHARLGQGGLKRLRLFRLHVDDEAVRCVGRRGLAPAADQVGAQQDQQHQRQQTQRQGTGLHHGIDRPGRDLARGQPQPARRMLTRHHAANQPQGQPAATRKQQSSHGKAPHRDQAQLHIAAGQQERHRKAQQTQAHDAGRRRPQGPHIAANHTQRRHLRQLQHRRQAKGQQQGQAHAQAQGHRVSTGRRQGRVHQPGQHPDKHMVQQPAQQHAQSAGHQAGCDKFKGVADGQSALALPQHAQQSAAVQMPRSKGARRQGHRHGAQQGGQQRHQIQKFLGPVQRLAHFRATAFQRLHLHAAHQTLVDLAARPGGKGFGAGVPLRPAAHHRHAVGQAAGRLHQAGGVQIGLIEHDARRKVHEARAPVGLLGNHRADLQTAFAHLQHIALGQAQTFKYTRIDPDLAGGGNARSRLCRGIARDELQLATQRVTGAHRFQGHEFARPIDPARHGRKRDGGVVPQTAALGFGQQGGWCGLVTHHHRIPAEQLTRIAPQTGLQSVGKKAYRGQSGHRQSHRNHQQPQLASAQIAPQVAPSQTDSQT